MKKPKAPDPVKTAQAQAGFNRDTATTEMMMNMVSQNNPWGSVQYDATGSQSFIGSDGKMITVPQYSQTTTFTPEQQAIFDASQQAETNLAELASQQSGFLQDYMAEPFQYTNQDAETWAYDLASPRILEQQGQNETQLRNRLINSGIRPGTDAWDTEMTRLTNANTDQLNQLALTGRQQGFGEALATRNQPINEITALLSNSQVSNPAQMSGPTPQTQVGGVDYSGLVQQNYQNKMNAYNTKMGGLFGLAGTGAQIAMMSDVRLKTDINRVGELDNGLPVYSYRYKSGGPIHIGVMAQDVEKVNPGAVTEIEGFKAVNYAKAVQ